MTQSRSQREKSGKARTPARLSTTLDKRLLAYIAAASAAGVGTLASSQVAEAEVVYTPANITIESGRDSYNLDLNHDGIADFGFSQYFSCTTFCRSQVNVFGYPLEQGSNGIVGGGPPSSSASALPHGAQIKASRRFDGFAPMAYVRTFLGSLSQWRGNWANSGKGVTNRYLGLKFKIGSQFHYGWARLTVTVNKYNFTTVLTGYAYETVANRPIYAGVSLNPPVTAAAPNTDGEGRASAVPSDAASVPATLGWLARGSQGLVAWRTTE